MYQPQRCNDWVTLVVHVRSKILRIIICHIHIGSFQLYFRCHTFSKSRECTRSWVSLEIQFYLPIVLDSPFPLPLAADGTSSHSVGQLLSAGTPRTSIVRGVQGLYCGVCNCRNDCLFCQNDSQPNLLCHPSHWKADQATREVEYYSFIEISYIIC